MNKENDDVVGRLGITNHYESGDENMCSMPKEASGDEPSASEHQGEAERILREYSTTVATLSATFFATIIVSVIVSRMWDEDEIKLHVLDATIKLLQTVARLCGSWALECERTYNEHVKTLH